jgi:hypothetical protein
MQGLLTGTHNMCHWMGSAIRLPREGIDLGSCDLHLVAGVDAFPDDVLSTDFQSKIDGLLQEFTTRGRIDRFVRTNWTALHRVTRIPVKAFVDPVRYPRIHARNTDGSTGLANFFPEEVNVHNIGSNHGLLSKLRGAFDAHNALPPEDQVYQIIVADSNIFQRILKVGFDFFFTFYSDSLILMISICVLVSTRCIGCGPKDRQTLLAAIARVLAPL